MIAHQPQTLFNDIEARQIKDMPYLNRQTSNGAGDRRKRSDEATMEKIALAMPRGEIMQNKEIRERTGMNPKSLTSALNRHPELYENGGRGEWRRL